MFQGNSARTKRQVAFGRPAAVNSLRQCCRAVKASTRPPSNAPHFRNVRTRCVAGVLMTAREERRMSSADCAAKLLSVLSLACSLTTLTAVSADFPRQSEWPCFRRDGGLLARSPARGRISQPRIEWKQFVGLLETELIAERGKGMSNATLPLEEESSSNPAFAQARGSFFKNESPSDPNSSADSTTTVFADVLPDEPGLEKIEFESAFAKPTVKGQWQPCVGRCFARRAGQWVQMWETASIDLLFQPLPQELILLDARTGRIKDRCRFTDTRSYGCFGTYDFDHDGRTEFLVMGDFSKHVDVLGFRDGKLSVLWQRAIELDISNPQKVLRVGPQPVADVDGDGRDEILISLFNDTGDQRWHLTVCDALTGRVKCELTDEQLAGVLDLDGDGASELLTTHSVGAATPDFGVVSIWAIREGTAVISQNSITGVTVLRDRRLRKCLSPVFCLDNRAVFSILAGMDPIRFVLICLAGWMNRNQQCTIQ